MNYIFFLWGTDENISIFQMCIRASVIFFITLFLLRIGGVRIFGKRSSFDNVITIILGAVLGRVIVGASPFLPTVSAALLTVIINRFVAWLCLKNDWFDVLMKGSPVMLYHNGKMFYHNLSKTTISESDIMESMRLETHSNDLDNVESIFLETNGRISFIKKDQPKK